jgi:hypothetical protein
MRLLMNCYEVVPDVEPVVVGSLSIVRIADGRKNDNFESTRSLRENTKKIVYFSGNKCNCSNNYKINVELRLDVV